MSPSSPEKSVFEEIEHLLARNQMLEAIERLRSLSEHRREAVNFSRRWHAIQDKQRKQILTTEQAETEVNRIVEAMLEICVGAQSAEFSKQEAEAPDTVAKRVTTPHARQPSSSSLDDEQQVFICYAHEDLDLAQQVYDDLERAGVSPWIDKEELLAGQKWELIIKQAMKSSSYVLVLLSNTSLSKRGFVQNEIKHAVKLSDEFPSSAIFILPVRLEECDPPEELEGLHWVDLFPDYQAGLTQLFKVLAPEGRESLLRRKFEAIKLELARLEQERGQETDSQEIDRLNTEIREVQDQQQHTETQLEHLREEHDARPATPPILLVPDQALRNTAIEVSRENCENVFKLDRNWRPQEYIRNEYERKGEIVFDRATGLMWQQSGSKNIMLYKDALKYVEELNRDKFAGYDDWRLPTIPELMSLLEPEEKHGDLYIDPVFDKTQRWCWSLDIRQIKDESSPGSAWSVSFVYGYVNWYYVSRKTYVRCVRS